MQVYEGESTQVAAFNAGMECNAAAEVEANAAEDEEQERRYTRRPLPDRQQQVGSCMASSQPL